MTILDILATLAWTASIIFLFLLFSEFISSASNTQGFSQVLEAALFIALLSSPTICCAIVWPVYLRQKRNGLPVFGWLPFLVLASSVWMYLVFESLGRL
nr:hypothetical protein [Roseovarius sp. W115]